MAGLPKLRISKYFGSTTIQQMEIDLNEAKDQLGYFWTEDGGKNIIVSIEGQPVKSFSELQAIVSQDKYKNSYFIEVGLFLSNDGRQSIWSPKSEDV